MPTLTYSMSKSPNQCNNCGKQGHSFHHCKLPITSYGIILFTYHENKLKFLMIRRKDSFGYIDFIRGKYSPYNVEQLQQTINEMSNTEKDRIKNKPFEYLWRHMWGGTGGNQFRGEESISSKKFDVISNGVAINSKTYTLVDMIRNSDTHWHETEWEFPKGRRNTQEKDIECAVREFEEETGYSKDTIRIVENIMPFEEIYIGSNYRSYKHKYFLAYMDPPINESVMDNYQKSEVSKIEWKTYEKCIDNIRPYNLEKKRILTHIYNMLQEYRLYL